MKVLKIQDFLNKSPTMAVIIAGLRLQKKLNQMLKINDLSLFQALILMGIFFEEKKSLRVSQLYELFPVTKGNISHMTSVLESKQLIERFLIDEDLRGFEFRLTAKGSKLSVNLVKIFNKIEDDTDKMINKEEFEVIKKILKEIG